jgi:membrane-associated phospholipid phosphatase
MLYTLYTFARANAIYFLLVATFLIAGLAWTGLMPKGALILWFSGHRSPAGNFFFSLATRGGEVAGFLLVMVILWRVHFRWVLALGAMTLAVALTSNIGKSLLRQPRPARYFRDQGSWQDIIPVPGIELHQGFTSLPSGHTMAAFAFFSLMAFCLKEKRTAAALAFTLALLTGLSRIYLVQHFEEDVLLGASIGFVLAILFYWWFTPQKMLDGKKYGVV